MAKWDSMDLGIFNRSEVMQEYAKQAKDKNINSLLENLRKVADLATVKKQTDEVKTSVDGAAVGVKNLEKAFKSLADDKESNSKTKIDPEVQDALKLIVSFLGNLCSGEVVEEAPTEEPAEVAIVFEQVDAKTKLLGELTKLASDAIEDGDTVLAYKIERAITEIKEEY